ncbi:MAG TPA: hypothetical protein VHB30_08355 [Solirubrobacteraceae bacterium]|jgi:Ca2+-binding RTX toxin-like protein|nr:hypothetical protein [Solirubrobacteraceae bacterium]
MTTRQGIRGIALTVAGALALAPAAPALAAHIRGGSYGEHLRGTAYADVIRGGLGNDTIRGRAGDDVLHGGAGNDTIFAGLGRDTEYGGAGDDVLWALARGDVRPGPGGEVDVAGDALDGGPGDDVFHVRDGEVDVVTCGPGYDVVLADPVDVIADATPQNPNGSCEKVVRAQPGA